MAIRPNGFKNAPAPPKTKRRAETIVEGGSPKGWTFISTAYACWRKWAYRYLIGLVYAGPVTGANPRRLGSAYHALLEGIDKDEVMRRYPDQVEQALKLYTDRMKKGPPLPEAEVVEEVVEIFGGLMTSKPDRVENRRGKPVVRDFKTAFQFSDYDHLTWGVDGGILGEMVAVNAETAEVDIQRKYEGDTLINNTRIVTVKMTEAKETALFRMAKDFWFDLARRLEETKELGISAFPHNLMGCVGKYGPCEYYGRCWGDGAERLLYKDTKTVAVGLTSGGVIRTEVLEAAVKRIRKEKLP